MKILRNHFAICIALLLAAFIFSGIFFFDFDFIDLGLKQILRVENNEMEELVTAFLLVFAGLIIDLRRARRQAKRRSETDEQRLRVLKATMRTVQDLVNNFLNNLQLFRMEAEDGPLSPESLNLFDDLIYETAEKLKTLGDLESVNETEMASGTGISHSYVFKSPEAKQAEPK
jgi:hypothetical protein